MLARLVAQANANNFVVCYLVITINHGKLTGGELKIRKVLGQDWWLTKHQQVRIFLSYSSRDRSLVEPIYLALCAQHHQVFFDRADLPPGEEYDIRIRQAIEKSHLFLFLISPDSTALSSYALTEIAIAQKTWPHPTGKVLPVVLRPVGLEQLPPYLKSVTLLQPEGNVVATVADTVHRIAVKRRRALLMTLLGWLLAVTIMGVGAYLYWQNRGPSLEITGRDGAPAVLIPAGSFTFGDDEEEPLRNLYVDAFYLDKYEVTTARYAKFLKATDSVKPPDYWEEINLDSSGALPVVGVDWYDAHLYCQWAGRRLPTEAEWEKAARGTDARLYPWGNDNPTASRAHFEKEITEKGPYRGGVATVGSHPAGRSPYGVEDLSGNVSEWVEDWYEEGFSRSDVRNPKGPASGTKKVIRNTGWYSPEKDLKSTKRFYAGPDNRADDIGFRCACDLRK